MLIIFYFVKENENEKKLKKKRSKIEQVWFHPINTEKNEPKRKT